MGGGASRTSCPGSKRERSSRCCCCCRRRRSSRKRRSVRKCTKQHTSGFFFLCCFLFLHSHRFPSSSSATPATAVPATAPAAAPASASSVSSISVAAFPSPSSASIPIPIPPSAGPQHWTTPQLASWLRGVQVDVKKRGEIFEKKGWSKEELAKWYAELETSFNSAVSKGRGQKLDGPTVAKWNLDSDKDWATNLGVSNAYHAASMWASWRHQLRSSSSKPPDPRNDRRCVWGPNLFFAQMFLISLLSIGDRTVNESCFHCAKLYLNHAQMYGKVLRK